MNKKQRIVIVGGVACGPKTACRLKRLNPLAQVTMLEKGSDISYGACGMPYFISGSTPEIEALSETPVGVMRNEVFFQKVKGFDVLCEKEAVAIDRKEKKVTVKDTSTGDNSTLGYDKLVLAVGGSPVKPPIPGIDSDGVEHFHSLEDARRLDGLLKDGKARNAVIVGGGLIGIEMAEALKARGMNVTLIEMFDHIMPALLDEEIGLLAGKHLKAKGVNLALGSPVEAFLADDNGALRAVKTRKEEHPAELAIVAIGVRPNSRLAEEAGLSVMKNGCIMIDEYCRTSDPDVYAGGDCVMSRYMHSDMEEPLYAPQGSTANKHGRIIANHIAGMEEKFPGVLGTVVCKAFDYTIGRTGLSEKWARELNMNVETVLVAGPDKPHFIPGNFPIVIKLIADKKSQRILGCQVAGPGDAAKRLDVAATAISLGATVDRIAHLDLAYAPPYSPPLDTFLTALHVMQNKLAGIAKGISPLEAKAKIEAGEVILLDVRSPKEFEETGLPYDVEHIPLGALRTKGKSLPEDKEILAFCKISLRGYEAQRILDGMGFEKVSFIEGGVLGWPFELRT